MILSDILSTDLLLLILIILVFIVGAALIRLELKLKRLCRGAQGKDLEVVMNGLADAVGSLKTFENESKSYFKNLERRLRRSTQAINTVRFNAFRGDGLGGNQSFATALLDEDGKGMVISSLYSRERVSVFVKPIEKFQSEIELSEEEDQAIAGAKTRLLGK